jgi:hypothetical protein
VGEILYEFEACPFCRKVREVFSILSHCHLSTLSEKWKPISSRDCKEKYGTKATYPFSKDPNMGAQMFESDAILEYLFFTYCDGTIPWTLLPLLKNNNNPIVTLTAGLGLLFRAWRGATYRTSNPPSLPLQVALYEGSPFCKLVQKTLCKLELEHTQVSCPLGVPIGNESLKPTVDSKCRTLRTPIWESASTSPRQSWNTSKTIWSVALTCQVFRRKSPKDERMTSTTVGTHDG